MTKEKKKYIKGLDGLRAIAIIGITLFHLFPSTWKGGYIGVCLFYVLTGFLLALTSKNSNHVLEFYRKRIRRIYPELITVILMSLGILFLFVPSSLNGMRKEVLSILLGYNNWFQIAQNGDYFTRITSGSPFTHFWFLAIELQFYLIWPFLLYGYQRLRKKNGKKRTFQILFIIVFALAMLMPIEYVCGFDITRIYYGTDTRIWALLLGAVLGWLYKEKQKPSRNGLHVIGGFAVILDSIILWLVMAGQSGWVYLFGLGIVTIAYAYLIWVTANPILPLGKYLNNPYLNYVGKHSYSIYLWQYPVIFLFNYRGWSTSIVGSALEILIIIGLALWLDWLLAKLKGFHFKKLDLREIQKTVLISIVVSLVFSCSGIVGLVQAKSEKADNSELIEQIDANKEMLENQTAAPATPTPSSTPEIKDYSTTGNSARVSESGMTLIGDSILLAASGAVKDQWPDCYIDAAVSRQLGEEQPILQELINNGTLGQTVVLCLGTNGVLYSSVVEQTLALIGSDHSVFWINSYAPSTEWSASNNEYLNTLPATYPNVTIVDWYSIAANHPEYLSDDGIHPNLDGSTQYALMLKEAMDPIIANQQAIDQENAEIQD